MTGKGTSYKLDGCDLKISWKLFQTIFLFWNTSWIMNEFSLSAVFLSRMHILSFWISEPAAVRSTQISASQCIYCSFSLFCLLHVFLACSLLVLKMFFHSELAPKIYLRGWHHPYLSLLTPDNLIHIHWNWNTSLPTTTLSDILSLCVCGSAVQMIYVLGFCQRRARDSTSKSSYLKTDIVSPRPPCFIFTVSWGVVFGLRLPFVMGLTMKMPVREKKQHCEKHSKHTLQLTKGQTHLFRALFEDFTSRCVFFVLIPSPSL